MQVEATLFIIGALVTTINGLLAISHHSIMRRLSELEHSRIHETNCKSNRNVLFEKFRHHDRLITDIQKKCQRSDHNLEDSLNKLFASVDALRRAFDSYQEKY